MTTRTHQLTMAALALALGVSTLSASAASANQKEIDIRGLVDCGQLSEKACGEVKEFFFYTEELGGGTQRVKVDISWIKPEKLPFIDQDDELCLTGFIREDQVYQATSLNERCDEGTVNDKEEEREKKDNKKEKDR